uniref:DOMON domain-containing protein n=1 Tax=Plectus sambesii TaxID=2011161 RepID=A0A914X5Q2_9BILA
MNKINEIPVTNLQSLSEYFQDCPDIKNVGVRRALLCLLEEIRKSVFDAEEQKRLRRRTEPFPSGNPSSHSNNNRFTWHTDGSKSPEDSASRPTLDSRKIYQTADHTLLLQANRRHKNVNFDESFKSSDAFSTPSRGNRASRMRDISTVINQDDGLYALPKVKVVEEEGFRKLKVGRNRFGQIGEKVMLLVGGTGSGKSTFVNALANYLYEVDFSDPFRFQLITAKDEEEEAGTTEAGKSKTKIISAYELNNTRLRYRLTIVDTPGFGDTEGIERDKTTVDYVGKWFEQNDQHGLKTIDAICIVIKGTETRTTEEVKHKLHSVHSLFDRNFTPNIMTVFTFCDVSKPPALKALSTDGLLVGDTKLFFNSIGATEVNTVDKEILKIYHSKCSTNFAELFNKLDQLEPHSVVYSLEVLKHRKTLEQKAIALNSQITELLSSLEKISEAVKLLQSNSNPTQCLSFTHDGTTYHTTLEEIFVQYGITSREDENSAEGRLERLGLELVQKEKELGDTIVSIRKNLNTLNAIAMRPEQATDSQYLQHLIDTLPKTSASIENSDEQRRILYTHLKIVKLLEAVQNGGSLLDVTESAAVAYLGCRFPDLYKKLRQLRHFPPNHSGDDQYLKTDNIAEGDVRMRAIPKQCSQGEQDGISLDSNATSEGVIDAELEEINRMMDQARVSANPVRREHDRRDIMVLVLVLFAALSLATAQQRPNFTHQAVLDTNGDFIVRWLPGTNANDYITFECEVRTQGWLGIGFSSNGGMGSADMVIAWIDQNGNPQISDRHGPAQGNGFPPPDDMQNYQLLSGRKNQTHIVVSFRRLLDTCDQNDWKITSDTTRMIWAKNDQVPTSAQDIAIHTDRGVRSVHLMTEATDNGLSQVLADTSVTPFDLGVENVSIPNTQRTLYWCKIIQLPVSEKKHVVATEMKVQPGNERYVHHLIMYGCGDNDMSRFLNNPGPCFDDTQIFDPMRLCGDLLGAWAVGGEAFVYPNNMGAPIFENNNQRFVLIEMHYDNPELLSGI